MKDDQNSKNKHARPRLSISASELPIAISHDSIFSLAQELGVDGIELMIGFKSRFALKKITQLSNTYSIPILSIHEPIYSWMGYIFDERAFRVAAEFNALYVSHPIFMYNLSSKQNNHLFEWLVKMKKKYKA